MVMHDGQQPSLHWWEKTVEYAFVRWMLPSSSSAIPLAGEVEAAIGDLLLKDPFARFRLIEFKAHQDDIQSEKRKFPKLRGAAFKGLRFQRALLEGHDPLVGHDGAAAHWLVFGAEIDKQFHLKAQRYCEEGAQVLRPGNLVLHSVDLAVMVDYLDQLTAARKREEAAGGSGSLVCCAVADGSVVPLSVNEFLQIACPDLLQAESPDPDPDPDDNDDDISPKPGRPSPR